MPGEYAALVARPYTSESGPDVERDSQSRRRDEILAVAAPLFAERGFHGVSIDDLGAALGVTGPALYRYFDGKGDVLAAMLVDISRTLLEGARVRVKATSGGRQTLTALVKWHVSFALDHPALISVQGRDLGNLDGPEQRTVRRLQRAYVEIWVDALRSVGPIDDATALACAHAVFGLINSTPHSARIDRDSMGDLLRRMAMSAIDGSFADSA